MTTSILLNRTRKGSGEMQIKMAYFIFLTWFAAYTLRDEITIRTTWNELQIYMPLRYTFYNQCKAIKTCLSFLMILCRRPLLHSLQETAQILQTLSDEAVVSLSLRNEMASDPSAV